MIRPTILLVLILNCSCTEETKTTKQYSFFVAGHTYGSPSESNEGLHNPFVEYIPELNNDSSIQLGFLTGDVFKGPKKKYIEPAILDIDKINVPIHIAAGNHDIGGEFLDYFDNYYYSFIYNNSLFIILAPGLDEWNITGDQLNFLKKTLNDYATKAKHIFIFQHELTWWSPDNKYKKVKINYTPHYPGSSNFDSVVKPLLLSYDTEVTIFAGDLGATTEVSSIMYDTFDNITLIASGMGSYTKDNIIIADVMEDTVVFRVISLSENKKFGTLEEYLVE